MPAVAVQGRKRPTQPIHEVAYWDTESNALIVSDIETQKAITKKAMSPSTMNKVDGGCMASWAAGQILPFPDDPFAATNLGNAVHETFEALFALPANERTREKAEELLVAKAHKLIPENEEVAESLLEKMQDKTFGLWNHLDPTKVEVFAIEQKMDTKVSGVPLFGFIDFITTGSKPNTVEVWDWKTAAFGDKKGKLDAETYYRKYPGDYPDQIKIYSMAVEVMFPDVKVARGALYYTDGDGGVREISLTPAERKKSVKKLTEAWDKLREIQETHVYETKPSVLCAWCPLQPSCPVANTSRPLQILTAPPTELQPGTKVLDSKTDEKVSETDDSDLTSSEVGPKVELNDEAKTQIREGFEMSDKMFGTAKPWDEVDYRGRPNGGSYAVQGAFGCVELAIDISVRAGAGLQKTKIEALAWVLWRIANRAMARVSDGSAMDGYHARMRGAIAQVVRLPGFEAPFGGDDEAWKNWANRVSERARFIGETAANLYFSVEDSGYDGIAILGGSVNSLPPAEPQQQEETPKTRRTRAAKATEPVEDETEEAESEPKPARRSSRARATQPVEVEETEEPAPEPKPRARRGRPAAKDVDDY